MLNIGSDFWSWLKELFTDGNSKLAEENGQSSLPANLGSNSALSSSFKSSIDLFSANRNLANENVDLKNLDLLQSLENLITGNYDFARNAELQSQAQAFNASEAQKSRDYNTYMSNTAYQRQVEDLTAAGLNPGVALGTLGASTGSSASASSPNASYVNNKGLISLFGNLTNILLGTLNSAVQTNNLDKKLDYISRQSSREPITRINGSSRGWNDNLSPNNKKRFSDEYIKSVVRKFL